MEEFAADSLDNDYEDIDSGGGFSSSDTKSRCQSKDMSTRPQFVLNAPDPAYVAVPLQFDRNTKQMPTADAEKYDKMAVMMGEEDVNIVASVVNTQVHGKAVLFPYAKNDLNNQGATFIDKNIGDDSILVDESEGGEDVTKAGADKEGEKLQLKRVARRIPKKKTNTLASSNPPIANINLLMQYYACRPSSLEELQAKDISRSSMPSVYEPVNRPSTCA